VVAVTHPLTDRQVAQRVENREWLGMQCVAMLGDELVLDVAAGQSTPDVPMTGETPLRWTCSSKVVTAILMARLEDDGVLDVELPVREYLPDFPEAITCAHLLNHSAGLSEDAEEPFLARDVAVDRATTKPGQPDFVVGEDRVYSSFANFAVLAAVAEAATGKDFVELVDTRVLNGAGFLKQSAPTWIGEAGQFTPAVGELIPERGLGTVLPGTGCVGTAMQLAELTRVMSVHAPDRPRSADRYVTRRAPFVPCRRSGDLAEWGLGFVVGRARFGRRASPDSYGHAGCRSSVVLHDPAHDLTIAVVSNTISKSMVRSERVKPFIPAIYADLGL
jgi:CubicO group peptidase (beta-lactamase class C family)